MKFIGTHNGKFHADEVFAVVLLKMTKACSPEVSIKRTRDEEELKKMDAVVDVGGVYDPATLRFDHHQPSFTDTFSPNHKTLLSSAGLVYKHFAKEIIADKLAKPEEDEDVELLYQKLYDNFVEPFDAHDNGISAYPSDLKPLFHRSWDIFAQVNILNPAWNEPEVNPDERFQEAMELMASTWQRVLKYYTNSWLPGRSLLKAAFTNQSLLLSSGVLSDPRILILDQYCPWTDHLFEMEESGGKEEIIYVLYEDSTKSSWRIHAVPKNPDSFECRRALPKAWRGMRDAELDSLTGFGNCVFVHRAGFIGAHRNREGAIRMAHLALQSE